MKHKRFLFVLALMMVLIIACGGSALPLRSDLPLDSLTDAVTYTRTGPAGNPMETNISLYRGMNEKSPMIEQETIFGKMSGVRTEDVYINGQPVLGMIGVKREFGYSNFFETRTTYYQGKDIRGNQICGIRVRHEFNRNITQYNDPRYTDYDAIWHYIVPCVEMEQGKYELDDTPVAPYALILNEVWQARIYWGSVFVNWGHSVTIVDGLDEWAGWWWLHGDVPNTSFDSTGATNFLLAMVRDLHDSHDPWLEFTPNGRFAESTVIYSAGDADQYANPNRILLNRQNEYVVFYRPDRETEWDYITVKPIYNYEFNDAGQNIAKAMDWGEKPFKGRLNEEGLPKKANDSVIAELEKVGCQNCPNASLEQIQFNSLEGNSLYAMTLRGYYGARDTLVIYSPTTPSYGDFASFPPESENMPERPVLRDEKGDVLPDEEQRYKTDEQWQEFFRESTIWNWHKDNPTALGADLFIQFSVNDASEWAPIPCSDGGTCGYKPVEWNLTANYFFDGNIRKAWLISNLLGEIGVRTLGLSYASNRFEGSGLLFAMSQVVFNQEYYNGFSTAETMFAMDARAIQLPDHLAEAWSLLHDE